MPCTSLASELAIFNKGEKRIMKNNRFFHSSHYNNNTDFHANVIQLFAICNSFR